MDIPKKDNGHNDWIEYRRLVLSKLDTLESAIENIEDEQKEIKGEQVKIKLDIRDIKTKATVWGGIAGFLVGLAVTIVGWTIF